MSQLTRDARKPEASNSSLSPMTTSCVSGNDFQHIAPAGRTEAQTLALADGELFDAVMGREHLAGGSTMLPAVANSGRRFLMKSA